ncbi:MAG: hypothetical protein WCJ30_20325, partial [Deltaproteobacteria bacterium]
GLRTDQAPPLSVWASFYLLAPLAMFATGAMLAWRGDAVFASRWAPLAMAATHLGTLGFLGAVILGSLYQMIPVVAGAPVPAVRLAHVVHTAFVVGVVALVAGLATGQTALVVFAPAPLLVAFVVFLVPVAIALARAPTRSETVDGMRLAVSGLLALATLGGIMAIARAGRVRVGGDWIGMVTAHAALGGAVWLGGLVTAVSWQVVPMFYLSPPVPRWTQWATLATLLFALLVVPSVVLVGGGPLGVAAGVVPASVMVWLVHPFVTLRAIQRRKRRRVDGSVRFWWAGLACAPIVPALAAGALLGTHPRWSVALGWFVVWGWAGMIVHGMLTRIVPFLVWFHRFAPLVGRVPVPSMRGLLPDPRIRLALALHAAAVLAGGAALLTGWSSIARAAGVLLGATAVVMAANLSHTLTQRPAREPPTAS